MFAANTESQLILDEIEGKSQMNHHPVSAVISILHPKNQQPENTRKILNSEDVKILCTSDKSTNINNSNVLTLA